MPFDTDIQDYVNAAYQSIESDYNSQWQKIEDRIRRHYADRGLSGGGDLARVLAEAKDKFSGSIDNAKQRILADAFRLQASRKVQREQMAWYEKMGQQQYADYMNYMNRMATAAAMGGSGLSDMDTHESRWQAFQNVNAPYGYTSGGYPIYNPNPYTGGTGRTGSYPIIRPQGITPTAYNPYSINPLPTLYDVPDYINTSLSPSQESYFNDWAGIW